jgi:hypothetical protein
VVPIAVEDKMRFEGLGRNPSPLEFGGGEVKRKKHEKGTKNECKEPPMNPGDFP